MVLVGQKVRVAQVQTVLDAGGVVARRLAGAFECHDGHFMTVCHHFDA
jgi:hypothetical protein